MIEIQIPGWIVEFAIGYVTGAISLFSFGAFLTRKQKRQQSEQAVQPPNTPLTRVK